VLGASPTTGMVAVLHQRSADTNHWRCPLLRGESVYCTFSLPESGATFTGFGS
jgi:hypothetical protein